MVITVEWVQQAVQDRGGDHRIAEHAAPFPDRAVRGDQDRSLLVAARDQLEEQVRGIGFERQIAELVDDQQLRPGQEPKLDFGRLSRVAEHGGQAFDEGI